MRRRTEPARFCRSSGTLLLTIHPSNRFSALFWAGRHARDALAVATCGALALACGGSRSTAPPAQSVASAHEPAAASPAPSAAAASPVTQDAAGTRPDGAPSDAPDNTPDSEPSSALDNAPASANIEQTPNLAPAVQIAPQARERTKAEQCAKLLEQMQDGHSVPILVQTQRAELRPERRSQAGRAACERVSKRLPASVRASASIGCDVGMIALSADAARTKRLCADRDVAMLTENQPSSAK